MYIKFTNSQTALKCTVSVTGNVATLKFKDKIVVNTSGFHAYLDKKCEYDIGGDTYEKFTTVYRDDEVTAEYNGYQLSNDGSIYVEEDKIVTFKAGEGGSIDGATEQAVSDYEELSTPIPIPDENYKFLKWDPEIPSSGFIEEIKSFIAIFEYVPTLEEVKMTKVSEMNEAQQMAIQIGVDVKLTDGTTEHFALTENDQTSLIGLQTKVLAGEESIPWHNSNQSEHCKYYSNADMAIITETALNYVAYHVTYFRDLRIYINELDTKDEVLDIFYGTTIPEQYQSEPLRDMVAVANA